MTPAYVRAIGDNGLVSPYLLGELEGLLRRIDGDDLRGRHSFEALDRDVPQATSCADHDYTRPWMEYLRRLLDGVVGGEPGVGVRGHVLGRQARV